MFRIRTSPRNFSNRGSTAKYGSHRDRFFESVLQQLERSVTILQGSMNQGYLI